LPKPQQDALLKAGHEAALTERDYVAKNQEDFMNKLRTFGVQFYPVDKRPFQQKMADLYKEFEQKIGKELLDAILKSE
jgi:TRAP-type C4-dicarboxylate transport system substrate-binding protein